jgi:YfiH family protein
MQSVLRAPLLTAHGFGHGFSTRLGGVSASPFDSLNLAAGVGDNPGHVAENQRRFAERVGFDATRLFCVQQVHGAQVQRVDAQADPRLVAQLKGDVLVAEDAAVGVRTADCVPILLADPQTRYVAAVHAGWRGVCAGAVGEGVRALCEASSAPASRLIGAVFPHIRRCCFEVGDDVALQLEAAAPGAACRGVGPHGRPHIALDVLVRAQLLAAGVAAASVDDLPGCTCCDTTRFFSYRRDGQHSGRHLAVIVAG